ncbi:MAG: MBL fold metallo-hydrolase [Anaerolineae bacterium]|nr:MBL fold metallo-hydrolase [Anaerolineae bacterium]MDW8070963.1 MBL fold metallo-hydrolase [Anaerolineae bacterium]
MEIIPGLYRIVDFLSTVYVIDTQEGLTLIDAGIAGSHKRIMRAIARLGYDPAQLRHILITHADGDHVGGVVPLVAASGARVYASAIEAQALARGQFSRPLRLRGLPRLLFWLARPLYRVTPFHAAEVVREGDILPGLGGLQVVETPGHTPGHLSFFAPASGILFAGDSMAYHNGKLRRPFALVTWDEQLALASLRKQAALQPQIVCLGHGPVVYDAFQKFSIPD